MNNILLVEDAPPLLEMYAKGFAKAGFSVDTAKNGKLALSKIKSKHYDVIVTGILMPDISGLGLIEKIRREKIKQGKIIIWSNLFLDPEMQKQIIQLKVDGWEIKMNRSPEELVEKVNEYSNKSITLREAIKYNNKFMKKYRLILKIRNAPIASSLFDKFNLLTEYSEGHIRVSK